MLPKNQGHHYHHAETSAPDGKAKELSHTTKKLGDLPPLEARRRRSVDTTR